MSIYTPDGDVRTGRAWAYGLLAALLVIILPIGLWAFGVFSSGPRGAGGVIKDRNSSQNIEQWSSTFNGEYQQLAAYQSQIQTIQAGIKAGTGTSQDQIDLQGLQLNCQSAAAKYNADTQNTLAVIPAGLPASISLSTYCGVNP